MMGPEEGAFAVRAEPAATTEPSAATGPELDRARWLLPAGAALLVVVLAVYLADLATHLSVMAAMRDLVVYRNGGLIVRHIAPAYDGHRASPLYDWTGQNGVQFTYPPFAAVIFAVASVLPWTLHALGDDRGQPRCPQPVPLDHLRRARLPTAVRSGWAPPSASPAWRCSPSRSSRPSASARSTSC